jgi:hypothetical protein
MDETMPPVYRLLLSQTGQSLRVLAIGDAGAPSFGTADPDILAWCERNDFLLVTNNRKSMPGHLSDDFASGGHVPGIIAIRGGCGVQEAVEEILLTLGASLFGELLDRIIYVPL